MQASQRLCWQRSRVSSAPAVGARGHGQLSGACNLPNRVLYLCLSALSLWKMAAAASGSGGSGAEPTVDSAAKRTVGPSVEVAALAEELSGSAKRKADRKPAGVVRISDSQRVPILGKDVEVTVLKEG